MIKTRTSMSGEKNVICASEFRSVADTAKHIIIVVVWKRAHISVTSCVTCRWGNNQLGWIFVVVHGFLSQVFCQICFFVWSFDRNRLNVMCRMLVSSRTWYCTGSFPFCLFCLVLFFRESALCVSKITMTSSKCLVRFISVSLKHTLRSFTVTTSAAFFDSFWTRTIPSTTAIF